MKHLLSLSLGVSLLVLGACSDSNDMHHDTAMNDQQMGEHHGEGHGHDHDQMESHMMDGEHMMAKVFIASPADGATVKSPVKVVFGLEGMEVSPAGMGHENSGHHHLIVNGKLPAMDKPMGGEVKHFGKGQTETELELAPGQHTLQLIMGDKHHMPHATPVISEKITITVE